MSKRHPRFKRVKGEKPSFRLQPRDLEMIRAVYENRFLNSDQIGALCGGSEQIIRRRLQKLFHHGFLDRPPQQFTNPVLCFGSSKMIYALGNKGADILAEYLGIERGKIDWLTKNCEVKDKHLNHVMMISNFRVCLALALRERHDIQLIFWKQEEAGELRDHVFVGDGQIPISPDGYFGLEDPRGKMYFFLEADQSTSANAKFLEKMKGYWQWWRQGKHTEKHEIKNFRVLTLCKTEQRKENLRKITKKADEKQRGSLLFWFVSEGSYNTTQPENVFGSIWQTPVDESWHSILE